MFEPMGGSAPKYTGKNVINPLATICAGGMMMDTLGEPEDRQGRRQGRPRRPGLGQDQEPQRRQDGHGHARGRRLRREAGELGADRIHVPDICAATAPPRVASLRDSRGSASVGHAVEKASKARADEANQMEKSGNKVEKAGVDTKKAAEKAK